MSGSLQVRIGRNLRAHRRRRGLSQEAFAFELGVHRTFVGAVERGERNITLVTLERIAARLGVDPSALVIPAEGENAAAIPGDAGEPDHGSAAAAAAAADGAAGDGIGTGWFT